jgi:hypothetical protein
LFPLVIERLVATYLGLD